MHAYRTHTCAELRSSDVGSTVRLSGWIHRKRDHGGVLFIDLRDHYGLTQVVCAAGSEALNILDHQRAESVANLLTEVYGIPPENLQTQGYGERFLKVRTESAEQQNRRVTIRRVTTLVRPVASAN